MEQPHLCSYCTKISFDALRTPYAHEIEDLLSGKLSGLNLSQAKGDEAASKVPFGPLSRIKRDSSFCELCALFSHIISRQGALYNEDQTLDTEDIVFHADPDVSYYGYISDARKTNSPTWVPRRLSLNAYHVNDLSSAIASFDHIFQACEIEASLSTSSGVRSDGEKSASKMLFGGRRRPHSVDVELLKRWMRICEEEHKSSCALTPSQKEHTQWAPNLIKMSIVANLQHPSIVEKPPTVSVYCIGTNFFLPQFRVYSFSWRAAKMYTRT